MIASKDRSGYFGASDTEKIMGNWNTDTWFNWWLEKIGIKRNSFENVAMNAGTNKEHQILEYVSPFMNFDKQIIIPELRLRVNYDGNIDKHIYECKTYSADKPFKVPKKYTQQVNVQMFAMESNEAEIIAYGLAEEDYNNYFLPICKDRLNTFPIQLSQEFISQYLPRITYLAKCLDDGAVPDRKKFS